jgi:hypothetical protein
MFKLRRKKRRIGFTTDVVDVAFPFDILTNGNS